MPSFSSNCLALLGASVLALLSLGGCATGPYWTSDTPTGVSTQDQRVTKAARINLDDQSVSSLQAPSNNLWIHIRNGFQMPEFDSPLVIKQTIWLSSRPDYVQRSMARSSRYLFYIVQEVNQRGMPSELALLPFVESAFNPQAKSIAKASGIWQFMPKTGKDFKLTQNVFRDERRDVLQSTDAALDYLQRLYKQFGDWQLALAAYNWGEGNVQRAIRKNQAAGLPTTYSDLTMPNETRNYVPKLMAYRNIVMKPEAYGIVLPQLENHPYFVAIDVTRDIDVNLAAKLAELPLDEFLNLNPSFNKPVILSAANQQILLPFIHAETFQANLKQYQKPLASWTAVLIPKSVSPEQAAKDLGVDVAQLREVNGIPRGMRIKGGSTVLIPKSASKTGDISVNLAENASLNLEKPPSPASPKKAVKPTKAGVRAAPTTQGKSAATASTKSVKTTANQATPSSNPASSSSKIAVK
ncbi:MAG: transglycosylase SLT domain-containing protein [Burkholderiales bacterium]|nr:transglycosylase SLT domain-containing protein [Burkholderiales bacterium]